MRILGELDADLNFTYAPYQWSAAGGSNHVRTMAACSATINNEMYVFGGQFVSRQVNFEFNAV